jgi:hypothetical protein
VGNKRNYREYLQSKLTRPLIAGEMVCIEMSVNAADYCNYVTDGIGILLTEKKVESNLQTELSYKATMSNPRCNMLDESNEWQLLSDVYTAKGGEEYITVGNFKADKELKVIRRTEDLSDKGYGTWSYMYIDDVKVRPVQRKLECSCENWGNTKKLNSMLFFLISTMTPLLMTPYSNWKRFTCF